MERDVTRRGFMKGALIGSSVITVPSFLTSCFHTASSDKMLSQELPANPFMDWFGVDEAVIRRVMAELVSRGADDAELYFEHQVANSLTYQDGQISQAESLVDLGVGLRVVTGDRVGFAFTEDLSEKSMIEAARSAASIASGQAPILPKKFQQQQFPNFYRIERPWSDLSVNEKIPLLRKLVERSHAADPAISNVQVRWNDAESRVLIARLDGQLALDRRPMAVIKLSTTAQKGGEVQTNARSLSGRWDLGFFSDDKLQQLVNETVRDTMILFEASQPPAGEMPVVLAAGASGILLHEAIGHGLEADFNRIKTSIYSTLLGEKIAEDFVNIIDDGTLDHERGALNVDDEGAPTQKTRLVENGRLVSYLHDSISAKHYKVKPTGSGRRQSFRHPPMPRMRCTFMEDGPHTREEIIQSVKHGIIAENFWNGQVNIGAGDYTFYIKNGWMIENGKITRPIKDTNIIGNGPESLRQIKMAANDAKLDTSGWTCGKYGQGVPVSQGLPTVLVSSLNVGGRHV
ncbi:MAG: TldD/PmbA family protein [Oligoflexus sp.]